MKERILIWGIGERTEKFMKRHGFERCQIIGMIDSKAEVDTYMTYPVYRPKQVLELLPEINYVVISNQYYGEIIRDCLTLKIPLEKIIITDNVQEPLFEECYARLEKVLPEIFEIVKNAELRMVKVNERDYSDKDTFFKKPHFMNSDYYLDYFRYRTFEFASEEIVRNDVQGAIAELGVFRGTFSAALNEKFPERKLYLFDTFEGFNEVEAENERKLGRCNDSFILSHKDTSIERMLKNLPYPEQVVVCQGFFPESLTKEAEDEKYAFVSLDVDFEESTYQGLKFFYPRLSEGGYIFIHDYNTFFLEGVKKAVQRFEADEGVRLKKVPLADKSGTVVIVK